MLPARSRAPYTTDGAPQVGGEGARHDSRERRRSKSHDRSDPPAKHSKGDKAHKGDKAERREAKKAHR